MIKKCLFAVCALVLVTACEPPTEEELIEQERKVTVYVENDITNYMFYVIDPRTGLCFARSKATKGYYIYAPVDCTDKVMELVINKQR